MDSKILKAIMILIACSIIGGLCTLTGTTIVYYLMEHHMHPSFGLLLLFIALISVYIKTVLVGRDACQYIRDNTKPIKIDWDKVAYETFKTSLAITLAILVFKVYPHLIDHQCIGNTWEEAGSLCFSYAVMATIGPIFYALVIVIWLETKQNEIFEEEEEEEYVDLT